jgi:hypothetical protein
MHKMILLVEDNPENRDMQVRPAGVEVATKGHPHFACGAQTDAQLGGGRRN